MKYNLINSDDLKCSKCLFQVDIRSVSVEINHLGQVFEGSLADLDSLMFENGYKVSGS